MLSFSTFVDANKHFKSNMTELVVQECDVTPARIQGMGMTLIRSSTDELGSRVTKMLLSSP